MKKFDTKLYPMYNLLNKYEKIILRTCFYYPPRKWEQSYEDVINTAYSPGRFRNVYETAFGSQIWSLIKDKKVLDLGCGDGKYAMILAQGGAMQIIGIDILPNCKLAQQESKRIGYKNVSFLQGSTEALHDDSFDVVISHNSFEHFEHPAKMLAEMTRLTKEGGNILIKFEPAWRSPWGRHMFTAIRRDRPWIHLIIPERVIMRCLSVYTNNPVILDRYSQRNLNKMTIGRFIKILREQKGIKIFRFKIIPIGYTKKSIHIRSVRWILTTIPVIKELFASGAMAVCVKSKASF